MAGPVGAGSQVLRMLSEHSPTHLLIAQDGPRGENFRRELAPDYKAHRGEMDPEISRQFGLSYEMADAMGWARCSYPAHEADDVLASAARSFPGDVLIVTGDKDLLALCSDRVKVILLRPGGQEVCGPDECLRIFGVRPERVQDYKALVGDSSDGISGVAGIGHKTATKLLTDHDSLDALYEALDSSPDGRLDGYGPSVTKKLTAGREQARLSYELAGMVETISLDHDLWIASGPRLDSQLGPALDELGLTSLRSHLVGGPAEPKNSAPLSFRDAFNAALRD